MLAVILILLLDTLVYMLIAWYVDAICPGDFGVPQPLYFPFTVSSLIKYQQCNSLSQFMLFNELIRIHKI